MRELEQTARGIYTAMQSVHHTGVNEGQSSSLQTGSASER